MGSRREDSYQRRALVVVDGSMCNSLKALRNWGTELRIDAGRAELPPAGSCLTKKVAHPGVPKSNSWSVVTAGHVALAVAREPARYLSEFEEPISLLRP
jgi:hypothetical protein